MSRRVPAVLSHEQCSGHPAPSPEGPKSCVSTARAAFPARTRGRERVLRLLGAPPAHRNPRPPWLVNLLLGTYSYSPEVRQNRTPRGPAMRRMRVPENESGRCPWCPSVPGAIGKGSGFSAQDGAEQGCCSSLPLGHTGKQNPREALPGGWARQQWVTRSRELGGTTRVKLGSAAAARPAPGATTSTGDAPREQGQDGAWALLRQRGAPTPTAQGSFLRAPGRGGPCSAPGLHRQRDPAGTAKCSQTFSWPS